MGGAIGNMLPSAVGVAISPFPIVAVVLILATPRARANAPAFLAGWAGGILVLGGMILLVAGSASASEEGQPADWLSLLKLALGAALLYLAWKQWTSRPKRGETVETPGWMASLDAFTAAKSAGLGAFLGAINPKNLLLVTAGAASIAQTGISTGEQVGALLLFTLLASLGVLVPTALYFGLGERSRASLDDLRTWMTDNNAAIMAVILLVLGVKLLGDAISGLS